MNRSTAASFRWFLAASLVVVAFVPVAASAQGPAPAEFDLWTELTSQALFSCSTAEIEGSSIVDSISLLTGEVGDEGHVRSNEDVSLRGRAEIHGDAIPGPGFEVTFRGQPSEVTGSTDPADEPFDCRPIDLEALRALLDEDLGGSNDNDLLPRTDRNRPALDGGGALSLQGNDGITLPEGTYFLSSIRLTGQAELRLAGPVRIFVSGDVDIAGNASLHYDADDEQPGNPSELKLWIQGADVAVGSRSPVSAMIYAPEADVRISGGAEVFGSVFASSVSLVGGSNLHRVIGSEPPTMVVEAPADGEVVASCEVPVRGTVTASQPGVTLTINDQPVELAEDGSFEVLVSLYTDDPGLIVLIAEDTFGNATEQRLRVEIEPPQVELTAPAPGSLVGERFVDLAGTSGTSDQVTVNGLEATVADGAFSLPGFDLGADGMVSLEIVGSHCAGSITATYVVDLDTQAPEAEIQSPATGDFFGASPISLSGRAVDAHLQSVVISGAAGSVDATVDGQSFLAEGVALAEGSNVLTATATDQLGRATDVSIEVTLDSTAPTVTITSPSMGAVVDTPSITVEGSSSDANLVAVQVRSPLGEVEATLDGSGGFRAVGVALQEGANALVAHAEDVVHNHTDSPTVTVVLDTLPPELTLDADGLPQLTAEDSVVVTGTVSDPHLDRVVVRGAGDSPLEVFATVSGDTYSAEVPLDEGANEFFAEAFDSLGHRAETSPVQVVRDSTPPALEITEPADGAELDSRTVVVRGTVRDAHLAGVTVQGVEATISGDAASDAGATFEATVDVPEGESTLSARAIDELGQSTTSATVSIVVDTLPPVVSLEPPTAPLVGTQTITVRGTVEEPHLLDVVIRSTSGSETPAVVTDPSTGAFEAQVDLQEGDNELRAVARDTFGHEATSAPISVVLDLTAPQLVLSQPVSGFLTDVVEIEASGLVADPHLAGVEVEATTGTVTATVGGTDGDPGDRPFTALIPLGEGVNTLSARATDQVGLETVTEPATVILDTLPPTVSLDPVEALTGDEQLVVTGTVQDANLTSVTVQGVEATVGTDPASGTTFLVQVPLVEGENALVAIATDALGHSAQSDPATTVRDTLAPELAVTSPTAGQGFDSRSITVTGTVRDAHLDLVLVNGEQAVLDGDSVAGTTWSATVEVPEGPSDINVSARDVLGHETTAAPVSVLVDTLSPEVTLDVPAPDLVDVAQVTATGTVLDANLSAVEVTVTHASGATIVSAVVSGDAASGATWSADLSLLEGVNEVTVEATDSFAHATGAGPVVWTLDTLAPELTLDSPLDGAIVTSLAVTVEGTVSDAHLQSVTVNGIEATIADDQYVAVVPITDGLNVLTAVATDQLGHTSEQQIQVLLDTLPPAVTIDVPQLSQGVCLGAGVVDLGGVFGDANPSDGQDGSPPAVQVEVRRTDGTVGSYVGTLDAQGVRWTAPSVDLGAVDGVAVVTVLATDIIGNASRTSASLPVDVTPPAVTMTLDGSPFPGAGAGAQPPAGAQPVLLSRSITLGARVTDGPSQAPPDPALTLDGAGIVQGTRVGAEGVHLATATATDCAGHTTVVHAYFELDLTGPSLLSTQPADGAELNAGIAGYSGTSDADLARAVVNGTEATVQGGAFSVAPYPWKEGENRVDIELIDRAGLRSTHRRTFHVDSAGVSVQILESGLPIQEGQTFFRPVRPDVEVSDSDATLTATLGGQPFVSGTEIAQSGSYRIDATATDPAGHQATASVSFTVDLSEGPHVQITSPRDGTDVPGPTVAVTGVFANAVSVTVNDLPATLAGDGTWNVAALPVLENEITLIEAIATDAQDRTDGHLIGVFSRKDGVQLLILDPADGAITPRDRMDIVGVVVGGPADLLDGTVQVASESLGVAGQVTAQVLPDGAWRAVDVPLAAGINQVTATALDRHSRPSTASVSIHSDDQPPTIAMVADGGPLTEGQVFSGPFDLTIAISDDSGELEPPLIRLNGELQPAASTEVDLAITEDGGYLVSVVARDIAGNEARGERSFLLDRGGCALSDIEPTAGSQTSAQRVSLIGRSGSAASVKVRVPQSGGTTEFDAFVADGTFLAGDLPLAVGQNDLEIVCVDAGGSTESLVHPVIRVADTGGPSVAIQSPQDGGTLSAAAVTVSGSVSAASLVAVNGAPANLAGTAFQADSVALVEGPNVLGARAIDTEGRTATDRVVVWRDSQAPKITLTAPDNNVRVGVPGVGTPQIDVTGVVAIDDEPNLASVTVGSAAGQVTASVDPVTGKFVAIDVPLDPAVTLEAQDVLATATDSQGQQGSTTVSVILDAEGPAIVLSAPDDLTLYDENSPAQIQITGEAWGAEGSEITLNGGAIDPTTLAWAEADASGRRHTKFEAVIQLPDQDGSFGLIARIADLEGRWAGDRRLLTKDSKAPEVVEIIPEDGNQAVDPNSLLLALFSESISHPSLSMADGLSLTRLSTGQRVVGTVTVAGSAVAFVPGAGLVPGDEYTFRAGTEITDRAGHPLVEAVEVTFRVVEEATSAAPQLDPLPQVVCTSELLITGTTAPSATVKVRDGGLTFTGFADAAGAFQVTLPISSNGYHLLHVWTVDASGSVSPESTAVVRVDCSAPRVQDASFDRAAGIFTVLFSEAVDPATISVGSAGDSIRLRDAEDPDAPIQAASISFADDALVEITPADVSDTAWWQDRPVRLQVSAPAADLEGNVMEQSFEVVFFPGTEVGGLAGGFLFGEVYDDATGRPLGAAQARLFDSAATLPGTGGTESAPVAEAGTEGRGRYTMAGEVAAGRYALLLERTGWTPVVRRLALEPAKGAIPFDARLTPRADSLGNLDPNAGGRVADGVGHALDAAPAALPGTDILSVRLTPLSGQGLPDFLPLGWTPAAAVELRLESAGAGALADGRAAAFQAGAVVEMPAPSWLAASDELVAVQYELATGVWTYLGAAELDAGTLSLEALGPGAVAVVVRDVDPDTRPPLPENPLDALQGVARPASVPTFDADLILDPPVIPATGKSQARVVARSEDGVTVWPSGLAVQAFLEEKLILAAGAGQVLEAPFSADLVLYHPPLTSEESAGSVEGAAGAMEFVVSPSPRAAQVLLEVGYETIRIYPFPEEVERGLVVGPTGGTIPSSDGVELVIPEGALSEQIVAEVELLDDGELAALGAIEGFDTLAAVRIDLKGKTLGRAATLRMPAPDATPDVIPGDPRLLLVELREEAGDFRGSYAGLTTRVQRQGTAGNERLVAAPDVALPIEGLVREGLYMVLWARAPIGYATGFVQGTTGLPLEDGRVVATGLGTADLARITGRYAVPVPAGSTSELTALHPVLDETVSTQLSLTANQVVSVDLQIQPVPPTLLSVQPVDGATDQPIGTTVSVLFDEPLDPDSIVNGVLRVELADSFGNPLGVIANGAVSLSASGERILFTPDRPLVAGRTWIASFNGSIRDAQGVPYQGAAPVTWSFTTSTVIVPGGQVDPDKFHMRIPVDGRAEIFADPGAIPQAQVGQPPWIVIADIVDSTDTLLESHEANADGSVSFVAGRPPEHPVTISDEIWIKVIDPAQQVAAHFRLGPFTSPDGRGFVAQPGEELTFFTAEGVGVSVPAGAFEKPTFVEVRLRPASEFRGEVPFDGGVGVGGIVDLVIDGEAEETLRIHIPAPPEARDDAQVFIGRPMHMPWGPALEFLSHGGVLVKDGERYLSNDASVQPEPVFPENLQQLGSKADQVQVTCQDVMMRGTGACLAHELLQEFRRTNTAVYFFEASTELIVLAGAQAPMWWASAHVLEAMHHKIFDQFVYLHRPQDSKGGFWMLPMLVDEAFVIQRRDTATGWLIGEQGFDPIDPDVGPVFVADPLEGAPPAPPRLESMKPFDLINFAAPMAEQELRLRFDIHLESDPMGRTTAKAVEEFPMPDHTTLQVWDFSPVAIPGPETENEQPKEFSPIRICGFGESWAGEAFQGADEMVMVVTSGDYASAEVSEFEFVFDRALDPRVQEIPTQQVATLEDLGPYDECQSESRSGYPKDVPLDVDLDEGGHRLILTPGQALASGHRFRLEIEPSSLHTPGDEPKFYWSTAPRRFDFATRPIPGDIVGSTDDQEFPFGDVNSARDMLHFGNLLMVGSDAGRIIAIDTTDIREEHKFDPVAIKNNHDGNVRTFATDSHNRLFYTALFGSIWGVKTVPVENAREAKVECTGRPDWAAGMDCFEGVEGSVRIAYLTGTGAGWSASEYVTLGQMPTGMPADLEVLTQDETGKTLDLETFYDTYVGGKLTDRTPDAEGIYTFDVNFISTYQRREEGKPEPSLEGETDPAILEITDPPEYRQEYCEGWEEAYDRYQRVTVDNLTTGQSWSFDIENPWPLDSSSQGDGHFKLEGLRAKRGDQLRVRYNVRALGYVAIAGSGISVVDLNRFYRLKQPGNVSQSSQCGRRLGKFEGATYPFPDCAIIFGQKPQGIAYTIGLMPQGETGCENGWCRGGDNINVYSSLMRVGGVQTNSSKEDPGKLMAAEPGGAMCMEYVDDDFAFVRDIVLANDVEWVDYGLRVNLEGIVTPPREGTKPRVVRGDLLFMSLGHAGIFVFDVSNRKLHESQIVGLLKVPGHAITRLQLDKRRGILLAGGINYEEPKKGAVIDAWNVRQPNQAPDPDSDAHPTPSFTLYGVPWSTNNLGIDQSGTGLIYTWTGGDGPVAVPIDRPQFTFAGVYRGDDEDAPPLSPGELSPSVTKPTGRFVPLGAPVEPTLELAEENKDHNERDYTAAMKVRIALPGGFGEKLMAKVQALRSLPNERHLGKQDIGGAVAMPGGVGFPETEVVVTLRRIGLGENETVQGVENDGEAGRYATAYNLYESIETVLLLADPRAQRDYKLQDITDGDDPISELADEKAQCRRCEWPSYLPDPEGEDLMLEDIRELFVGGRHIRAILAEDLSDDADERANQATRDAIEFFEKQEENYPLPWGTARIAAPASSLPSPVQASLAEPAQHGAMWDPDEAGVSVSLASGEAFVRATDYFTGGRGLPVSIDRSYRSGLLGYGPLGIAGWSSNVFAHLRENEATGEVEYFDGEGQVWRFYPMDAEDEPDADRYEKDDAGSYWAPKGVYLRLIKLRDGGWKILGRYHDSAVFDAQGRLIEVNDRHRRISEAGTQGNTHFYRYDAYGQLAEIEDDLGRRYRFEYFDDPKPEEDQGDGPKYGLLKKFTDFIGREVEYDWSDERELTKVMLPEVTNDSDGYSNYAYEGARRPAVEYKYDPDQKPSADEENQTAALHGQWAQFRLAESYLPEFVDSVVHAPRVRFEYDEQTGRVDLVSFPDGEGQNNAARGVEWRFDWNNGEAMPSDRVDVETPWGHELLYGLKDGRVVNAREELEIVQPNGTTLFEYSEREFTYTDDGRLTSTLEPDGAFKVQCYLDGKGNEFINDGTCLDNEDVDRLAKANVIGTVHRATTLQSQGSADYTEVAQGVVYHGDNLPSGFTDGVGRSVEMPVPTVNDTVVRTFTTEGIGGSHDIDQFGRPSSFQGNGESAVQGEFRYDDSADGEQEAGLLKYVARGIGENRLWAELEYDDGYNVEEKRTSFGTVARTTYDEWDRPVKVETGMSEGDLRPVGNSECSLFPEGTRTETAYDAAGHVIRQRSLQDYVNAEGVIDCRWVESIYTYNAREQVVQIEMTHLSAPSTPGAVDGQARKVQELHYDEYGRLKEVVALNQLDQNLVTTYRYDGAGRIAGIKVGDAAEEERGYDQNSRIVRTTDGDEAVWLVRYDAWNRVWNETHPTGAFVYREFDKAHQLTEEETWADDPGQDGEGTKLLSRVETDFTSFGEIARVIEYLRQDENGAFELLITEQDFDESGRTEAIWSGPALPSEKKLDREKARREVSYTYESGTGRLLITAYGGDEDSGPLVSEGNVFGTENGTPWPEEIEYFEEVPGEALLAETRSVRLTRDTLGRVIRQDDSNGSVVTTNYDRSGGPIRVRTGSGAETSVGFDGRGLPVRMIRPTDRGETRYAYDLDGRLRIQEVTNEGESPWRTEYRYDPTGRIESIDRPDGTTESFIYNDDNTLDTAVTREGLKLTVGYDAANRITSIVPSTEDGWQQPASLAPLDSGDSMSYDELSRPLSLQRAGRAALTVSTPTYDLASRPESEIVGSRSPMTWTWDEWSRPVSLEVPGLARTGAFEGYDRVYDTLDRVIYVSTRGALSATTAGASWTWGGQRPYAVDMKSEMNTSLRFGYVEGRGPARPNAVDDSLAKWQLGTLTWGGFEEPSEDPLTEPENVWGQFEFGYRGEIAPAKDGAKIGRAAVAMLDGGGLDLFAGLGWVWDYDAGVRLSHAVAGRGDISGRAPPVADGESQNSFTYEYGEGDELELIVRNAAGDVADLEIGPQGRIARRSGIEFSYDAVGRRTEDDRFVYLWNWRSELVQVSVKDEWPGEEESPYAGHQIRYEYDAAGRLHRRTHLGILPPEAYLPDGTIDESLRPLIDLRVFVWEGSGLVSEIAYADLSETQVRWRKSYVPGVSGYDDAIQMAVELVAFPGSTYSGTNLYTFLRDEQGTVIGLVAEDESVDSAAPAVPVRYHYTPYGEAHAEVGPEMRRARFDGAQNEVWISGQSTSQTLDDGREGALRVEFTAALDSATLSSGLTLEELTPSGWQPVAPADLLIGFGPVETTEVLVLRQGGWTPGGSYRATFDSDLKDTAGRSLYASEPLEWQVLEDSLSGAGYDQRFPIAYESFQAAQNSVDGRFPGGQTSLFQGLWTDPATGQSYARARWYDARNASWLVEDPMADIDSPNLYAFVGWQPNMSTDPLGLCKGDWKARWLGIGCKSEEEDDFGYAGDVAEGAFGAFVGAVAGVTEVGYTAYTEGVGAAADQVFTGFIDLMDNGVERMATAVYDTYSNQDYEAIARGVGAVAGDYMLGAGVGKAAASGNRVVRGTRTARVGRSGSRDRVDSVGASNSFRKSKSDGPMDHKADTGGSNRQRAVQAAPNARRSRCFTGNCFEAGTLVATPDGLKPIEEIEIGDEVWAFDETNQSVELREVTHLFTRQRDEIYVLSADNLTIRTTSEHPFYVEGEGWVEVEDLRVNDLLRTQTGDTLRLDKIEVERGREWVYNFTVEGLATYFVSDGRILVHNCDDDLDSVYQVRIDPNTPGRPHPDWSVDTRRFENPKDRNSRQFPRDSRQFWEAWKELRPETLSRDNLMLISGINPKTGRRLPGGPVAPKVDDVWLEYFRQQEKYKWDKLLHHHVGQGPYAIPVPQRSHVGSGGPWHGFPIRE